MAESRFQASLIKKLKRMFPGCVILKNDSSYLQGICDLTILWGPNWAWLEVKDSERSPVQPNQQYYVDLGYEMSYAAFIYPSNEEQVLDELQQALSYRRASRFAEPE